MGGKQADAEHQADASADEGIDRALGAGAVLVEGYHEDRRRRRLVGKRRPAREEPGTGTDRERERHEHDYAKGDGRDPDCRAQQLRNHDPEEDAPDELKDAAKALDPGSRQRHRGCDRREERLRMAEDTVGHQPR